MFPNKHKCYGRDLTKTTETPNTITKFFKTFFRGGTPPHENEIHIKTRLLAHGDYTSISNCRTKILEILRYTFIIFCGILKQVRIYSTLLLSEPLKVFCETSFEKHCSITSLTECNSDTPKKTNHVELILRLSSKL